ncbi:MAG TPA: sigma-70 family RNA polymerase sigma factor [Vicinamibacterales bacterium]
MESDASLVERARAGDREAFRVLVDRHSRSVFRLAFRLTGNEHDADEVVQEAFIKAHRQLPRFEARSSFGTWLYRITANCAVDLIRARKLHEPLDGDGAGEPGRLADGLSRPPSQEQQVLSSQIQARVRAALALLTDQERTAFVLRHIEGLGIEEIAEQMNLRENATKHSIFRAVKKMRLALGQFV